MIGLGDQPQVEERSVRAVREASLRTESPLVVPSFQMRRGHPWLAARSVWEEILLLKPGQTPREFLNAHADKIHYVDVNTPGILADLDTPDAYEAARPKFNFEGNV
jgi:molybdenum cofactor cytidylyltransferase